MSDETKVTPRNKGGRPKKAIRQKEYIGVKCTLIEKIALKQKAKATGLTLSEYLRQTGMKGQAVSQSKPFLKEILQFTGTLNHLAANLNQLAKKRNTFDVLNAFERDDLKMLSGEVKQLVADVKKRLL